MPDLEILTSDGHRTTIPEQTLETFASGLRGETLRSGAAGYDEARAIWNGMVDRRPALVVRCAGVADVRRTVGFARERGLLLAVRGGGHHIAGNCICDDGLLLDLSPMRSVRVDPQKRTARVEPGATLADFDHEAQAFGLATPLGINSTTGVAGLTLGGGFGWLTRKYGMTVDNLLSADLVTADGELLRASEEENPDLFWALRGGSGNFGVVTSFEYRLHPVGPEVFSGLVVFPLAQARAILDRYRDFVAETPEELSVWIVLRQAPPLPFLPESIHGKEVLVLATLHTGDVEEGERAVEPLRGFGKPAGEMLAPHPYAAWQKAFDPLLTPGARNYWKSHNIAALEDGLLDVLVEQAGRLPDPQCEVFVAQLGGAMARVAPDATAYAGRDANFVMNVHARWEDPAADGKCIEWARHVFDAVAPYSTGGAYVNFMTQDETERVRAAYGPNYDRLGEVKNRYDPQNLFRLNHNVRPTVGV